MKAWLEEFVRARLAAEEPEIVERVNQKPFWQRLREQKTQQAGQPAKAASRPKGDSAALGLEGEGGGTQ